MSSREIISRQYPATYRQLACGFSLLFLVGGCQPKEAGKSEEQAGEGIVRRYQSLLCEKEMLERQTLNLWDEVSSALDARLPRDMPADERRNMIKIRNTDLIQMFEIYPQLDTSIKNLVEKAGDQDDAIVVKLRQLQAKIETEDINFMQFVADLEKRDRDRADAWKKQMEKTKQDPCNGSKPDDSR